MDVSRQFDKEFQHALSQLIEISYLELFDKKELWTTDSSPSEFGTFAHSLVIPNQSKAINALNVAIDKAFMVSEKKFDFLNENADNINRIIERKSEAPHGAVESITEDELKIIRKRYLIDLSNLTYINGAIDIIQRKVDEKKSTLKSSTVYKWEFTDHAYMTGSTIGNTLRDELIAGGLISREHPNSSKENFKLLFHAKNIDPHFSAQPIVWLRSYTQLYYLVSRLTKKVIKLKRSKPSHIDVIFHIFREHSEDSPFQVKNRRPNDIPEDKPLLDKIIANVESQIFMKK
jgi:hypothetical protein